MCDACVPFSVVTGGLTCVRIDSLNKVCGDAYRVHYECLDNHNQQYKDCRPAERGLNFCVWNKIVSFLGFEAHGDRD